MFFLLQVIILLFLQVFEFSSSSLLFGFNSIHENTVFLSSSGAFNQHNVVIRSDFPWIRQINSHVCLGLQGDISDCEYIFSQLEYESKLYEQKSSQVLSPEAVCSLCQRLVSKKIRSTNPLNVCGLIGGIHPITIQSQLFWFDNVGASHQTTVGCHGKEFPFILSLFDYYGIENKDKSLNKEQSLDIIKRCWMNIRSRTTIPIGNCQVISINKVNDVVQHKLILQDSASFK